MGQARILRIALIALSFSVVAPAWATSSAVTEAQAMVERGELAQALRRLDEHLRSAPQDAEARFTRGLVLVRMDRSDDAIKAFQGLTRDYPQLPEPYNNLAVIYAQQGDYEKARDALEAALATHPSYGVAHENLGDIYAALAAAAYNRALTLDQGNTAVRAKLNLINQLDSLGDARGATVAAATPPVAVPESTPAPTPAVDATPVTTPAVPTPAAAPAQPPPKAEPAPPAGAGPDVAAIEAAVQAWAAAWAAQDIEGYLAAYAPDFVPRGGISRKAWEAQRRQRVGGPDKIIVQVSDLRFDDMGNDRVKATFSQHYESNVLTNRATKVLELGKAGGQWKILREYTR